MEGQLFDEFIPGQWSLVREYIAQDTHTSYACILVQAQFLPPSPITRDKNRAEDWLKPADILCCQKMQCAAHAPCTDDCALRHSCMFHIGGNQSGAAITYSEWCSVC